VKWIAAVLLLVACSGDPDGISPDAVDRTGGCASTFGSELTDAFGRIDGTVLAVLPPNFQACAQPNSTHLVVQVMMHGAAYRMVFNVDANTLIDEHTAPLAGPAWEEGWHTDAPLDYVTTLGVHSDAFSALGTSAVLDFALTIGDHVSVYATSTGGTKADSAHLIHRNLPNADGALVIHADSAPRYFLVRFDNQSF
jgi:hypothetical protein